MSRQNRVTPFGEIIATPARGTLMGNRGCLHNGDKQVIKSSARVQWITCALKFKAIRRSLMTPGDYTELFFLDEATALTAGHRPCAHCRGDRYKAFKAAWNLGVLGSPGAQTSVRDIDDILKGERHTNPLKRCTYRARLAEVPDGAMTSRDQIVWLKWQGRLHRWAPEGYAPGEQVDLEDFADVLTPPSIVKVLQAGYLPEIHPSAR